MTISPRDRGLIGGVAVLLVAAALYVLVIVPQHHQAAALQRSIASTQTKLATAQAAYASGRAAQAKLALTGAEYLAARRAVPQQSDVPALLRLLQRTSAAADVKMNSISFGTGASSTATSSAAPAAGTAAAPNSIPVSLSFGGGYVALRRLVHRLDALVVIAHGRLRAGGPLVGISNISLSPGSSSGTDPGALTVSLTATIYQNGSTSPVTGTGSEGVS